MESRGPIESLLGALKEPLRVQKNNTKGHKFIWSNSAKHVSIKSYNICLFLKAFKHRKNSSDCILINNVIGQRRFNFFN